MKQAIPCPNFGKITKSKILPISILTVLSLLFTTASAQLVVDQNASIAAMQNLIEGTGLTISNFTITAGQNQQYGTFTYTPDGVLGLDQGIILSTGTCNQAIGPNNTGESSSNRPDYADPDILLLSPLASRDACVIEFDVVPKCDTLQIDFVFASEEYNEWVCSDFNDAFAFFVSGPGIAGPFSNGAENFAILPDGTGVAIGSVNNGTPGGGMDPANCQSLANAAFFTDNTGGVNLQHDGFTVPLSAKGVVVPCQTYHVKLVIADAGDSSWDSAVFLKSFSCPGQLVDINPDPIFPNVVEGCQFGIFRLERGGDTTVALDVDLTFGGTAIYNVDYSLVDIFMNPAPTTVSFAANETVKIFALLGTQDFTAEGVESIDITATWNICSEVLSATQSFELQDVSVALVCPADMMVPATPGLCGANVTWPLPTVISNCNGVLLNRTDGLPFVQGSFMPLGTYTISYTGIMGGAASDNCSFNITVFDNEAPTINCPANITTNANASGCSANITMPVLTATDNCGIASITNDRTGSNNASGNYPLGTTVVNWTVTDVNGNVSTCSTTVVVNNSLVANAGADASVCIGTPYTITGSASGGTAPYTYSWNNGLGAGASHAVSPGSTTTYTVTVTDANGCTSTDAVTLTTMVAPNATVSVGVPTCGASNGSITFTFSDTPGRSAIEFSLNGGVSYQSQVNDNSGSVTYNGLSEGTYNLWVRWGNDDCPVELGDFLLAAIDTTNPTIICPAAVNANTDSGACFATVVLTAPATSDNCAVASVTNNAPATFPIGTTTVTWTVTDNAGNSATCTQNVTVTDNENPTITCAAAVNANTNPGSCFATVVLTAPATSDNCTVASVTNNAPATFPIGTTTVTWTVTDNAGNTATCTQNVTVTDNENPTITCAAAVNANTNPGSCFATVVLTAPATSDNCTVASVTNNAPATFPIGTTTVTWTVTDNAGNTATCTQNVTVTDNENPTITCAAAVNANTNPGSCFATVVLAAPAASDNCTVASVTNNAPVTFPIGTTTVTWTVTDNAGNTATCTQNVTVTDNENPTITCPANVTAPASAGSCFTTVVLAAPATSDNCTVASVTNNAPATFPIGTTAVTWTVTDNAGNSATCTQNVTVTDNENPTITCAAAVNANADPGSCFATVVLAAPVTSDNCGIAGVTNNAPATFPIGTTTVTWTVTDNAGNTATCTQNVTVTDNQNPTITCAAAVNANTDPGSCF
ncbi:MAG: HYR domain-containing protein, partial [Flavobacteriales bacterium]|nr:HYR domain-containing protein [Flavobacteriales bacterium]